MSMPGTTGQIWPPLANPGAELPPGGAAGDVLTKLTSADYDVDWLTPAAIVALSTSGWLPLTTTNASGDDVLVFDADGSLVPTLIPF